MEQRNRQEDSESEASEVPGPKSRALKKHSLPKQTFFCESCHEYFQTLAGFNFHNKNVHIPQRLARVKRSLGIREDTGSDVSEESGENLINNNNSDEESVLDSALDEKEQQLLVESPPPTSQCELCEFIADSLHALTDHKKQTHDFLECHEHNCGQLVPRADYIRHLKEHVGGPTTAAVVENENLYDCDSSSSLAEEEKFPKRRRLYSSLDPRSHNPEAILRCPNCPGKWFTKDDIFSSHMQTQHGVSVDKKEKF